MGSSKSELVNKAYNSVTFSNNTKVIFKINQAFLDRYCDQTEALLQPHQARALGIIVDDCAKRHIVTSGQHRGQCI